MPLTREETETMYHYMANYFPPDSRLEEIAAEKHPGSKHSHHTGEKREYSRACCSRKKHGDTARNTGKTGGTRRMAHTECSGVERKNA